MNPADNLKFLRERTTRIEYHNVLGSDCLFPVIRYKIFDPYPEISVGFSTRLGGVSRGYFGSLNLSFTRGDDEACVMENHRRFAEACGYDMHKIVCSDQVHGTDFRIVTAEDAGSGLFRKREFSGIDGMITNIPELPLMTFYADCVPLFLYDPQERVIAAAHSGWRGTIAGIGTKAVILMQQTYGCRPENLVCAIGPSICGNCYEVGQDVADACAVYPADERKRILTDNGNGKYRFDLHQACYCNFIRAGVLPAHIAMPDLCTCCNPEFLFSHRKSGGKRGNLGGVIKLNKESI